MLAAIVIQTVFAGHRWLCASPSSLYVCLCLIILPPDCAMSPVCMKGYEPPNRNGAFLGRCRDFPRLITPVSGNFDQYHVSGRSGKPFATTASSLSGLYPICASRQSAVRRPEQAAARTDWRKRLRREGILFNRSWQASTLARSFSSLATMRRC